MLRWVLSATVLFSLFITWSMRRYALRHNILDIPNHRSSHLIPTPRGGGISFVMSTLLAMPILNYLHYMTNKEFIAFFLSGFFIAMLGFFDDKQSIRSGFRLLGHFIASLVALYWLGGMPALTLFNLVTLNVVCMSVMAVFYLVWSINLYNFMDGIDGLAGLEAVFVCLGGSALYWLYNLPHLSVFPMILAAAVGGFLYWNLPPARVFMGDAGSGFLGLMLGLLSVQAAKVNEALFWSWLILLGIFIVDATTTLLIRAIRREALMEAHRQHAYQRAAHRYQSHAPVTLAAVLINVFWLFPIALLVGFDWIEGGVGLVVAYTPLFILALLLRAGRAV